MAPTSPILDPQPTRERFVLAGHIIELYTGEDGMVCAAAVDIRGCYSQGRDRAEALANIREAIEVSLPAVKPTGRMTSEPAVALLEREAREGLKLHAAAADLTDPQPLREAIKQAADIIRKPAG